MKILVTIHSVSINVSNNSSTAQKLNFSIKDFFSKCDQIRSFLRIWSHLLKRPLMENFIFCARQHSLCLHLNRRSLLFLSILTM